MLGYYIKTAFRSLLYQKFYSGLNIIGLGVGLASCLIITLFILQELSFDNFHKDADQIHRVYFKGNLGGDDYTIEGTPPPLANTLLTDFPEVELASRIYPGRDNIVRYEDKFFQEQGILGVDSGFLKIFSFQLLKGVPARAFSEPNSVVLTEEVAHKYFANETALGKVLFFGEEKKPFTVTGIIENPPFNSYLTYSMLTSISSYEEVERFDWSWVWCGVATYIKLKEQANAAELEAKFPAMVNRHASRTIEMIAGKSMEDFEKGNGQLSFFLQPLKKIHLYSADIGGALALKVDIKYLYIFSFIAIAIVLLACVNFMNLSTARAARRSKEVGVRKVMGSFKRQLIWQFLTESLITSALALLFALGLSELFLELFSEVLQINPHFAYFSSPAFWLVLGFLFVLIGLLAGFYPAFYLSSISSATVLKDKNGTGFKGSGLRNILVVLQFSVSICLLICTVLVHKQLNFLQAIDLGLQKENVIVIHHTESLGHQVAAFKQALSSIPKVSSAASSQGLPFKEVDSELFISEKGLEEGQLLGFMGADNDFIKTLQIKVKEGRSFSGAFPSDWANEENGVLLNEAAVNALGLEEPLGKELRSLRNQKVKLKVVGIVKDFNFQSLHNRIEPLVIMPAERGNYLSVRVNQGNYKQVLSSIEEYWNEHAPESPFTYSFLDDNFDALYSSEQRQGKIFFIFTGLAIFIACLGLLGLSAYAAAQRTKEIGIRKALGSSTSGIVKLLSNDFVKLVLIANVIAWPLAWYSINRWLQSFAYRINIDLLSFVAPAFAALLIALVTISLQSLKAALANPVDSLRSE